MSKYVPDISTKRWVLIAPGRTKRTHSHKEDKTCIFCPGNEDKTATEIYRLPENSTGSDWKVRVIVNKYPITDIHEVIIITPEHHHDFENMSPTQAGHIFQVFKNRYLVHRSQGQVFIFGNHKKLAGASIDHPHAQLVVIPNQINMDALLKQPVQNIIEETGEFTSYCPEFSQWPYEIWIVPKKSGSYFGDVTDENITGLSKLFKSSIKKLEHIFIHSEICTKIKEENGLFAYNYYIYPKSDWYLRIVPRFVSRAGFELGTGLSVNIVDPIEAAEEMKKI